MHLTMTTLAGHEIIVERAKDGDAFQTLDGQVRKLDHTILMINDGEKEVGIAGIMGGENTKITRRRAHRGVRVLQPSNGTDPGNPREKLGYAHRGLRKVSKKAWIPVTAEAAVDRACQLIEELGCGRR